MVTPARFQGRAFLLFFVCTTYMFGAAQSLDDSLIFETFRSANVTLKSGQIANTPPDFQLQFPTGAISIRHMSAKLVDANNRSVPLSEVYIHHWLVFQRNHEQYEGNGGYCAALGSIFGIGAEMYGTPYDYPAPYGVTVSGNETWTANLHFIRTSNVPAKDLQDCIECRCVDSAPPLHPHGSVQCCENGQQCWGMANSTLNDPKDYYLLYKIGYVRLDGIVPAPENIPLTIFSIDATASHLNDCQTEYDVPGLVGDDTSTLTGHSVIPSDMSIVFVNLHQHIGGVNLTVEHWRNSQHIANICSVVPVYGTGGFSKIGNETGYVVAIPPCIFPDKPYQVREGDLLKVVSIYSGRTLPEGHNWHGGVMGLAFIAAHATVDDVTNCQQHIVASCGSPPYQSSIPCAAVNFTSLFPCNCMSCVDHLIATQPRWVQEAKCTQDRIGQFCDANSMAGGNIPAPASVTNMRLQVLPLGKDQLTIILTSPQAYSSSGRQKWFGFGFNPTYPQMKNSLAWVFTEGQNLQQRQLGNHAEGNVVNSNVPFNKTVEDGQLTLHFVVPLSDLTGPPYNGMGLSSCVLMVQGESSDLTYHGSSRGYTCLNGLQDWQQPPSSSPPTPTPTPTPTTPVPTSTGPLVINTAATVVSISVSLHFL